LNQLVDFDKDNIPEETLKEVKKITDEESFNVE